MKEITFTIDGYSFSTVPSNSRCREQCCSEIADKTGKTYFWMREETGNKNWVLYNPNEYYVRKDSEYRCEHLHLSRSFKGKVRLPINASSYLRVRRQRIFSQCRLRRGKKKSLGRSQC